MAGRPLNSLFTPTPQHHANPTPQHGSSTSWHTPLEQFGSAQQHADPTYSVPGEIDSNPVFQEMNYAHLAGDLHVSAGNELATPHYINEESTDPLPLRSEEDQDDGAQSPPYFCKTPEACDISATTRLEESREAQAADSPPYECKTPQAYEQDESGEYQVMTIGDGADAQGDGVKNPDATGNAEVVTPVAQHQDQVTPKAPQKLKLKVKPKPGTPSQRVKVTNMPQPIVLKTYEANPKAKQFNPGAEITATVEECFTESWFFKLPEEVRNRIYRHYFFPSGTDLAPRPSFTERHNWRVYTPALLRSSSDIRKEALSVYNRELRVYAYDLRKAILWLQSIDYKARQAISCLYVRYDHAGDRREKRAKEPQQKTLCRDRMWKMMTSQKVLVKKQAIKFTELDFEDPS